MDFLNAAEERLWDAFHSRTEVDLGGGKAIADTATAADWGPDQQVRAEMVTGLLLGAPDAKRGHPTRLVLAGARVTGRLDLAGAAVAYGLHLENCWLDEPFKAQDAKLRVLSLERCRVPALQAWALQVDGPVTLTGSRFNQIGLVNATIAGRLHLSEAILSSVDRPAMHATRMVVEHSMLGWDLIVNGEIRLLDAQIGGALLLSRAKLINPGRTALHMHGIRIEQGIDCGEGFTADGDVRLSGARVAGRLIVDGAVTGTVDLTAAQIQTILLPSAKAPPTRMDGLTYTDLKPDEPAAVRLGWLRRDPDGYRAQPYEQLAGYYRRLGHDEQARRVLLAKRRAYRETMPWWRRMPGLLMDALAGYGYAPLRAVGWLAAAWLAGWWYFAAVARPPADAALYALDVLVPTSPFGLEDGYRPHDAGVWVAAGLQALGWALSLAVLPALARAFNRG
jgi:hypothetical protein